MLIDNASFKTHSLLLLMTRNNLIDWSADFENEVIKYLP